MKFLLAQLLVLLFFISCAKRSTPTGGEGDITPPQLYSSTPQTEVLNFSKTSEIELVFSEWIEPNSAEDGISIHPVPEDGVEIKVRARKVTVKPKKPLLQDITYHLSINSEVKDFSGNSLEEPVEIVFSTGDFMDSATVDGCLGGKEMVGNEYPKIALFRKKRVEQRDTILLEEPDYLTQCDSNGRFGLTHIAEGDYTLFGFSDTDKDNKLSAGEKVFITEGKFTKVPNENLTLSVAKSDTTNPKIADISAISSNQMTATITPNRFLTARVETISEDSTEELTSFSAEINRVDEKGSAIISGSSSWGDEPYNLILSYRSAFTGGVDSNDVEFPTTLFDTTRFNGTTIVDSTEPKRERHSFSRKKTVLPVLAINWSQIVVTDSLEFLAIEIAEPQKDSKNDDADSLSENSIFVGDTIIFRSKRDTAFVSEFSPVKDLKKGSFYRLFLDSIKTVSLTGIESDIAIDSLLDTGIVFSIPKRDQFAEKITIITDPQNIDAAQNPFWLFNGNTNFNIEAAKDTLVLKSMPVGSYSVSIHYDLNSNSLVEEGTLFPFKKGEEILYFDDTIVSEQWKKRWDVEYLLDCIECDGCWPIKFDSSLVEDSTLNSEDK
jgi:hypothetical protein